MPSGAAFPVAPLIFFEEWTGFPYLESVFGKRWQSIRKNQA